MSSEKELERTEEFVRNKEKDEIQDTHDIKDTEEIEITIKFFSTLRSIAGSTDVKLQISAGISLAQVLESIEAQYFLPKNSHILSDDHTNLEVGMICLIDDTDINIAGGLRKQISKPVTITLISSLHGG